MLAGMLFACPAHTKAVRREMRTEGIFGFRKDVGNTRRQQARLAAGHGTRNALRWG